MASLDLVRAEIKCWERDFASRHGRDPSVQDIRDQPHVAEKYKLYKKLSRAAAALPKSRPADSVPPLPGFNPFSPAKKTAALRQSNSSRTSPHANPFATPAKNNPKSLPRAVTPSPDLPHPNTSPHHLPVSTAAVSRARKRLRGDPVSPSPNKPKRQRIRSQALPPFPKLEQDSSNSDYEADHELPQCDFTVADSPVKAPAGGKSFKLLFDDALPALSIPKKPVGSSVTQLDSPPDASFSRASADPPVTTACKLHCNLTSTAVISWPEHRANRTQSNLFPTRDHVPASSHGPTFATVVSGVSQPRTSMKRALDSGNPAHEHTKLSTPLQSRYPLIPPSPPPQDSIHRDTGKGKAKNIASRKKLRVEDEESDKGVDSPDDISLKVATVSLARDKRSHRHADDLDWDPLLHLGSRNHEPAARQQIDANHHASGTFSVDLPDKFRRVLAISPSRSWNNTEERVVRGLLYGDRVGHYDPSRGGVIWDAGETDDTANGDLETEDDWEGEPVPWEFGEL